MPALPQIDSRAAIAAGTELMPPGPALEPGQVSEVVHGLRAAAEASVAAVAEVTRLGAPARGAMLIVDRTTWLRANVEMVFTLLAEASGAPPSPPERLRDKIAGRANGAQLGGVLALLGTRLLGQFLPFLADPPLLLVAPNVARIERELGVDPDDFRLWVCLHEQTHRQQFARARWLRRHLIDEVARLLTDEPAERRWRRPRSLVEAFATPAQQEVFVRVSAAMSLLEGYADDMMDRVGPEVVPTVATIRDRFEKRRNHTGWATVLHRAIGMDLKLAQYRDGARFCRAVIDRVGVDGLNLVYDAPGYLPTTDEIADPDRWVRRVHR